ncbi:MAG: pentapeptide repeat-containing protein [Nitrospirae bacterium]|nr:pentapeptide repeat-containing protein [Nitrospirota bacterium]
MSSGASFGEDRYLKYDTRDKIYEKELADFFDNGTTVDNRTIKAEDINEYIWKKILRTDINSKSKIDSTYNEYKGIDNNRGDVRLSGDRLTININNSTIKGTLTFGTPRFDKLRNDIRNDNGNVISRVALSGDNSTDYNAIQEHCGGIRLNKEHVSEWLEKINPRRSYYNYPDNKAYSGIGIYVINAEISITNSEFEPSQRAEPSINTLNVFFCREVNFSNTIFYNEVNFPNAAFSNNAIFNKAIFNGAANYNNVSFSTNYGNYQLGNYCNVNFNGAVFKDNAVFTGIISHGPACFTNASFNGKSAFSKASFRDIASFYSSTFRDLASFTYSRFHKYTYFNMAVFNNIAYFQNTIFNETLILESAIFNKYADFHNMIVRRLYMDSKKPTVGYGPLIFHDHFDLRDSIIASAYFGNVIFTKDADFTDTCFGVFPKESFFENKKQSPQNPYQPSQGPFIGDLQPCAKNISDGEKKRLDKIDNTTITFFKSAKFESTASFIRTVFKVGVYFGNVSFEKEVDFSDTLFGGKKPNGTIITRFADSIQDLYHDIFIIAMTVVNETYSNYFKIYFPDNAITKIVTYATNCYIEGTCTPDIKKEKKNYMFSYLNINKIKLSYDRLPPIEEWVSDNNSVLRSYVDPTPYLPDDRPADNRNDNYTYPENTEPISSSLKKFEAAFRSIGQEGDANKAVYYMYVSKHREDLADNTTPDDGRKNATAVENIFHTNKVRPIFRMIFFGVPSRYGRDLGRLILFSLIILISFTAAYMREQERCNIQCEIYDRTKHMRTCGTHMEGCAAYAADRCDALRRIQQTSEVGPITDNDKFSLRLFQFPVIVKFPLFRSWHDPKTSHHDDFKNHFDLLYEIIKFMFVATLIATASLFIISQTAITLRLISTAFLLSLLVYTMVYKRKYKKKDCKASIIEQIMKKEKEVSALEAAKTILEGDDNSQIKKDDNQGDEGNGNTSHGNGNKDGNFIDAFKEKYDNFEVLIKERFPAAFLLSLVLLFKVGYKDMEVRSTSLFVLIYIEWLLGFVLYAHLFFTLKNTVPLVGALLDKLI